MTSCGPAVLSAFAAIAPSDMSRPSQVESHGIVERALFNRNIERSRRVAMILKARQSSRLRLVGVDGEAFVIAAAGVGDVVDTAPERTTAPAVVDIEGER